MATYAELFELRADSPLRNRVTVAVVVKAQGLIDGASPTAAEITWSEEALRSPVSRATEILNYVLAANKAATVANITGATDAAIQSNVDAAADALIAGGA
jgi:hypothetical protein